MGFFTSKKADPFGGTWSGAEAELLTGESARVNHPDGIDVYVLFITFGLLVLGALMVYSASISLVDNPKYHTDATQFLYRHLFSIGFGCFVACCVYCIPMRVWERLAPVIGIIALLLLVLVLIPGIGKQVNGARRWINMRVMNVQVSEIVKIAVVLGAAAYAVRRQEYMHSFSKGFFPMLLVMGPVAGLIGLQPDLGATMVIIFIAMGVFYLGGLDRKICLTVLVLAIALGVSMIYLSPWRLERFMSYLDVWSYAEGKGYQLSHSLIAFGRGEWFGVGLGASLEKLHYLPEAHTDFIMAIIAEEHGFVGVVAVVFAFYWLVRRAFAIGRQANKLDRAFSGLVAQGIGIWIGMQSIVNMGVASGLLPTKGLTLPLVSYGGSSMVATMIGIALLLRVDCENRILMRGGRV